MTQIKTTCPYCGVGCGITASLNQASEATPKEVGDDIIPTVFISGTDDHPANFGRLCSKGSALAETILPASQSNRLLQPSIEGEAVSWDAATKHIAEKIQQSIEEFGPDSVAFYLSGQLLTEDYYVANKLIKGYVGTANVDTNSRLCMASAVVGYKRAFGSDTVPCNYDDLEKADLLVLIGSNAAWTHPILYQRMVAAKEQNPNLKVVLIDPRKTATSQLADLHLQIDPSSDGFVFAGLLNYLSENAFLDHEFIESSTEGFEAALELCKDASIANVAKQAKVSEADLTTYYQWFAETKKAISFYSQGINQSATGTDKCNAIINCHLATGKIGYEGAGPFSITGQPNAMGGREVGGLANQLAAHMDFAESDIDRVQRFWDAPVMPSEAGLKAVDLFDAIDSGRIKVLWVMATNPAVSLPNANLVKRALEKCPTVIVSDVTHNDTTAFADVLLPAEGWSEKDGTVTNSERRISRQRRFIDGPGESKPDWWALAEVGKHMGYADAFNYRNAYDVFVEHAKLSAFENEGSRDFDLSGLMNMREDEYHSLSPIQWPVNSANPNGTERMFADKRFFTPSKKARFVAVDPKLADCLGDHLLLNTGRIRDQWHTMTRTGLANTLNAHDDVPFVEMNAATANKYKLVDRQYVALHNELGKFIGQLQLSDGVKDNQVFSPIHWSESFSRFGTISNLVPGVVDPFSGQPESKVIKVSVSAQSYTHWIKILSRKKLALEQFELADDEYASQTKLSDAHITVLGVNSSRDWVQWCLDNSEEAGKLSTFKSEYAGNERLLVCSEKEVELMVFIDAKAEALPSHTWMHSQALTTTAADSAKLFHGEQGEWDNIVCGCFRTSRKTIVEACKGGATSFEELSGLLGCGSKCGSCKPEIHEVLELQETQLV